MADGFENCQTQQEVDDRLQQLQQDGQADALADLNAHLRKTQIHSREALKRKRDGGDDDEEWLMGMYDLEERNLVNIRQFRTQGVDYTVKIRPEVLTPDITVEESLSRIYHVFKGILHDILGHLPTNSYARVVIMSEHFAEGVPLSTSMQKVELITPELIFAHLARIAQSKKQHLLDGQMDIHVISTTVPEGRGRKKNCIQLREKKSIMDICNEDDNLCLASSIVVGQYLVDFGTDKAYQLTKAPSRLKEKACILHRNAKVPIKDGSHSIADAKKFQEHLKRQYQIVIISSSTMNKPAYTGIEAPRKIFIYHHDDHYDLITHIDKFYSAPNQLCETCWTLHRRDSPHYDCQGICRMCMHKKCKGITKDTVWIVCDTCHRYFPNKDCFANHSKVSTDIIQTKSSCDTRRKCLQCNKTLPRWKLAPEAHECGKTYCTVCQKFQPADHKCFVQAIEQDEEKDSTKWGKTSIYYFDFETDSSTGQHLPIMLAMSSESGSNKKTFWGADCAEAFCSEIFTKNYKHSVFLSHNGGRFDNFFILDKIFKTGWTPQVIYNGGTIMYIRIPKYDISFKDTYLYLARPLAALPKMFGIPDIAKTFFPHLLPFNEYESYEGDYVDFKYYDIDNMKQAKRDECIKWVNKQKDSQRTNPFNYKEDMMVYCANDVDVLRECGERFRSMFIEKGQIDPFIDAMTLSQASSYVYRKLFMPEDTIAIIPPLGYPNAKLYSNKSILWLEHVARARNVHIKHARNGGEKKLIESIYVDGFKEPETELDKAEVWEFLGCLFHGCVTCYSRTTKNPLSDKTMQQLHDAYLSRKAVIENAGYKYNEIWEHTFDAQMKEHADIQTLADKLLLAPPLVPRDCLYGGRTEPFNLYRQADKEKGEIIRYLDVNSLYPHVQRASTFPKGHPNILISPNLVNFPQWFGLIKARITPPEKLWLPVLPLKAQGKLLFCLCHACAIQALTDKCKHSYRQRGWVGSYTTVEVAEAVKRGYTIDHVYEVWDWPEENRVDDLFTDYINCFLKLKLIGSGFPRDDMSQSEKVEYARKLSEQESVDISASEIHDNPGIRALGKQVLNGLWGKFCQSLTKEKTIYITEPAKYFEMLLDDKCEINSVRKVNDQMIEVSYKTAEELAKPHPFVNHALASFVTSYARLHLYKFLEPLGKNLLYCDTDSCVFATGPGLPDLPTGPYLGEMSCEIFSSHKVDDSIGTWVSVGPKSYGYQLRDNAEIQVVKCKGITLNFSTSKEINMKYMVDLVDEEGCRHNRCQVQYPNQMKRDKKKLKIEKICLKKTFGFTFNKRLMNSDDHTTLPIGYR